MSDIFDHFWPTYLPYLTIFYIVTSVTTLLYFSQGRNQDSNLAKQQYEILAHVIRIVAKNFIKWLFTLVLFYKQHTLKMIGWTFLDFTVVAYFRCLIFESKCIVVD